MPALDDDKPSRNELLAQVQNKLIEDLRSSEKRYSDLVEQLRDVVFQLDADFKWLYINQAWLLMAGYTVTESVGQNFTQHIHPDDISKCQHNLERLKNFEIDNLSLQIKLITADKKEKTIELSCRNYTDEIGVYQGIVGILSDITERVESQKKITYLAYHDVITGLANRRLLLKHIQNKMDPLKPSVNNKGLIFIDLDKFKQVNDIHGHVIGDLLLCNIAEKLKEVLASSDCLISRIGGDEFAVSLDTNSASESESKAELMEICHRILDKISEKTKIGILTLNITASIGVVLFDPKTMDQDNALKFADSAMYKSKRNGRNSIHFYDKTLEEEEEKIRIFEAEVENAVINNEFVLHYQPQIEIKTNKITKFEALIRWEHPIKGIIYPDDFIPYLEKSGLIIEVGSWVFEESCKQLEKWIQQGVDSICLSINISAHQITCVNFIDRISTIMEKYSIPPALIELELTESIAVADINLTIERMNTLNALGVKIALDDFGTGYSSLAYLKYFPIHTLKIDKSFIKGVPFDGYDSAIVETTMVMSRHLGLQVVAEGVENETQLAFLKGQNCQLYQGFLCSKPIVGNDITSLLKSYSQPHTPPVI